MLFYGGVLTLTHVLFLLTPGTTRGHFYKLAHKHVTFKCPTHGVFSCMLDICSFFSLLPTPKTGFTQVPGLFPLTKAIHWWVIYSFQAFDIILCL